MLVFVPLSHDGLADWVACGVRDVAGFAATASFLTAFGLDNGESEDADLTLLEVAGIDGLLSHGVRLIAVGRIEAECVEPEDFGAVAASGVPWSRVECLFADDEVGARRAAVLRDGLAGAELSEAWDAESTEELLRTTELLWHGATEWQRLTARK